MAGQYSIGDLAKASGTKVETIRYYERIGVMPSPARLGTGRYRRYEPAHAGRLMFVRRARELGFSIDQVRQLLGLADNKDRPCSAVDSIARQHLDEVDRKIADLTALRGELQGLIEQCSRGTIGHCRVISALSPQPPPGTKR
jgi:DNA-binding transcriptional MerR regulator